MGVQLGAQIFFKPLCKLLHNTREEHHQEYPEGMPGIMACPKHHY